jgi:hypothetical protein
LLFKSIIAELEGYFRAQVGVTSTDEGNEANPVDTSGLSMSSVLPQGLPDANNGEGPRFTLVSAFGLAASDAGGSSTSSVFHETSEFSPSDIKDALLSSRQFEEFVRKRKYYQQQRKSSNLLDTSRNVLISGEESENLAEDDEDEQPARMFKKPRVSSGSVPGSSNSSAFVAHQDSNSA